MWTKFIAYISLIIFITSLPLSLYFKHLTHGQSECPVLNNMWCNLTVLNISCHTAYRYTVWASYSDNVTLRCFSEYCNQDTYDPNQVNCSLVNNQTCDAWTFRGLNFTYPICSRDCNTVTLVNLNILFTVMYIIAGSAFILMLLAIVTDHFRERNHLTIVERRPLCHNIQSVEDV